MIYDTIIIGGGPAGSLAAERLAAAGKKVLLIEADRTGGVCLNTGCIPTKTLLHSAKLYAQGRGAEKFGVTMQNLAWDWGGMQKWKDEVTDKLRGGLSLRLQKAGVEQAAGRGEILKAPGTAGGGIVRLWGSGGETVDHQGRTILVAVGSLPLAPPIPGAARNPLVVDSTALLSAPVPPKRLVVIGGGVIGVEFAALFSGLGAEVTVFEMAAEILPFMDREQAPLLRRAMRGVDFRLGRRVTTIEGGTVLALGTEGGEERVEADLILLAAGRGPRLSGWGAEAAGLGGKEIVVDLRMRTAVPGIWAAGDLAGKSLLAHAAYRMGEVAAADILAFLEGRGEGPQEMRYDALPWAVYGLTEAAGVGLTAGEAAARGIPIESASIPMRFSGRFAAEQTFAAPGAVKLIAAAGSRKLLGIHAVGAYAPEFIWGGAALIETGAAIEDLRRIIFPHPTVAELIREAAFLFNG